MYARNEDGFCRHMCSFVPHITNQDQGFCHHQKDQPAKSTPDLNHLEHPEAVEALKTFIEGYLEDREW